MRSAIDSARSGCYDALLEPVPVKTMQGNCYLVERFAPVSTDVGGAAITQHFLDREASHLPSENIQLNLLGEYQQAYVSGRHLLPNPPPVLLPLSLRLILFLLRLEAKYTL